MGLHSHTTVMFLVYQKRNSQVEEEGEEDRSSSSSTNHLQLVLKMHRGAKMVESDCDWCKVDE